MNDRAERREGGVLVEVYMDSVFDSRKYFVSSQQTALRVADINLVLDTITNTGGGNFTAAVATLCSGGTTTISPKTLQECCLRFAAAKFCRDWRMHVDERKPVNVSGLFADDIEPFLIELTRTESDLDNNTGSVGIVVESFREFVMMHCPPASLLVSDGNYDLWRMVCMRRLCGNSPKTKTEVGVRNAHSKQRLVVCVAKSKSRG
jgi:hypothetical protein